MMDGMVELLLRTQQDIMKRANLRFLQEKISKYAGEEAGKAEGALQKHLVFYSKIATKNFVSNIITS